MPPFQNRRPSLDGLRGLAAVVVVVHHSLLIAPVLANSHTTSERPPSWSWPWIATYTPLHLLWAGGEAVLVFFVLSGLVLALPAVHGRKATWRSYYPQRLLRLYIPIIVATALALLLVWWVPRNPPATSSSWLAAHVSPIGIGEAARDAAVLLGWTDLNSALWSLKWEVIFSLLLPAYLILFVRVRRWLILRIALLLALIGASNYLNNAALLYLPIFGLGVLMAQNLTKLDTLGNQFNRIRPITQCAISMGTGLMLLAHWWMPVVPGVSDTRRWSILETEMTLLGACLLVWLFSSTAVGIRVGTRYLARWLGKRSFSLYLVHEPIVVTVAYLLGGTTNAALVLAIALPVSLLFAQLFGVLIEMPAHRLAKSVGQRLNESVKRSELVVGAIAPLQQPS